MPRFHIFLGLLAWAVAQFPLVCVPKTPTPPFPSGDLLLTSSSMRTHLLVSHGSPSNRTISAIEWATGQRSVLVPFNVLNSRAARDGTLFVYIDSSFILYAADVFGFQQQLTTSAVKPDQIASFSIGFTPDSAYFVFVDSQLTNALYSVPSRGSGPVVRLSSPTQTQAFTGVSISPNSLWVAYLHSGSLFVSSIATGSNVAIASPAFSFLWSRDSLSIVYTNASSSCAIFSVSVGGTNLVQLTSALGIGSPVIFTKDNSHTIVLGNFEGGLNTIVYGVIPGQGDSLFRISNQVN